MLRAYSKNIEVKSGNAIPFNIDKLDVGNHISHQAGSENININVAGFYEVNLDISFTTVEETTNPVNIQLYANGNPIPDALINTSVASTTTTVNSSFNTIIEANIGMPYQKAVLTIVTDTDIQITSVAIGVDQ